MRILILGAIALAIGVSLGYTITRMEFEDVAERLELATKGPLEEIPSDEVGRVVLVNGTEKDFGLVKYDSKHTHQFVIRNDGEQPLEISMESLSCPLCVSTDFVRQVIEPGDEYELEVSLTARKTGSNLHESLEIATTDPENRRVTFSLKAFIGMTAKLSVEGLQLGDVSATDGTAATCRIYGYYGDEMELADPTFTNPLKREFMKFEAEKLNVEDLRAEDPYVRVAYEITVRVLPGVPVGPIRQNLKLVAKVPGEEDTTLELPMKGQVAGDLGFIGPSEFKEEYTFLSIGRVAKGKSKTFQMHVRVKGQHRDSVELMIDTVDPEEALTASLGEPMPAGREIILHPLTISVPNDAPSINRLGTSNAAPGRIVIKTTHPTAKELVLLVRFAVE